MFAQQKSTEQAGVSRQAVCHLFKGNDVQVSTLLAVMEVLQLDMPVFPRALKRGLSGVGKPAKGLTPTPSHSVSAVQQQPPFLQNLR